YGDAEGTPVCLFCIEIHALSSVDRSKIVQITATLGLSCPKVFSVMSRAAFNKGSASVSLRCAWYSVARSSKLRITRGSSGPNVLASARARDHDLSAPT